jgi:hypothetical protein
MLRLPRLFVLALRLHFSHHGLVSEICVFVFLTRAVPVNDDQCAGSRSLSTLAQSSSVRPHLSAIDRLDVGSPRAWRKDR